VTHAQMRANQAAEKIARLEQQMMKLREERDGWKQRHQDAVAAAGDLKKAASRAEDASARARADAERANAQVEEWRTRAQALTMEVREVRDRLEEARRVGTLAREHLMVTETKLDLIEAAIQVLDARTREAALPRP
jgi:chromosome segregation ATPase